eukprot:4741465-Pyramimonas_sp.AAC.1
MVVGVVPISRGALALVAASRGSRAVSVPCALARAARQVRAPQQSRAARHRLSRWATSAVFLAPWTARRRATP